MYIHNSSSRQMAAAFAAVVLGLACVQAQNPYPPTVGVPVAAPAAQLPTTSLQLEGFSTIQVCLPVNVLVVPTSSRQSTFTAGAEPAVLQALSASVNSGVLYLQSSGTFNTSNVVTVQVRSESFDACAAVCRQYSRRNWVLWLR